MKVQPGVSLLRKSYRAMIAGNALQRYSRHDSIAVIPRTVSLLIDVCMRFWDFFHEGHRLYNRSCPDLAFGCDITQIAPAR